MANGTPIDETAGMPTPDYNEGWDRYMERQAAIEDAQKMLTIPPPRMESRIPEALPPYVGAQQAPPTPEPTEDISPDPGASPVVSGAPKPATSWVGPDGKVYTRGGKGPLGGWRVSDEGTSIIKTTQHPEGGAFLQGRGIPALQEAKAAKDAEKESKRRAGMSKQELYDEYVDKAKSKILDKAGIDVNKDYVAEAEAKIREKWARTATLDTQGNFIYEQEYKSYTKELAEAMGTAARKTARGKELLGQAVAGIQADTPIPKEGIVISSQGGATQRGNENVKQGEIGYIFEVNKATGKSQIVPLQGWSPAKGTGAGSAADGTGAGGSAIQKAAQDWEINGVHAKVYNLISGIIQEYASQYDSKIAAAKKIREAPGSSPADRQQAATEASRAEMAKRLAAEVGSGQDVEKILKVMADPSVAQMFMDPATAKMMDSEKASIYAKYNPDRRPGATLPPYVAGGQVPGKAQPGGQSQIYIGMTQPYVYKGQKIIRQFTGKGPDGKWQWMKVG